MNGKSAGVGSRKTMEQGRAFCPSMYEEDVEAALRNAEHDRPPEHLVEETDMLYLATRPQTPSDGSDDDYCFPDSASECRSPLPHSFRARESCWESDDEEENEEEKENAAYNRSEGLPKPTTIPKLVSNVLSWAPFCHENDPQISGGSDQSLRTNYSVKKMGLGHLPEATRKLATEPLLTASFPPRSPPCIDVRFVPTSASSLIAQWQEHASPVGMNSRGPASQHPTRSQSLEKSLDINSERTSEAASLTTFSSVHNLDDGSLSASDNGVSSSFLDDGTIETREQDGQDSVLHGESPAVSLRHGIASSASSSNVDHADSLASSGTAGNDTPPPSCESPVSEVPSAPCGSSGSGIPLTSCETVGNRTPPMDPVYQQALENKRLSSAASRYAPKAMLNSMCSSVGSAIMQNPFLESDSERVHDDIMGGVARSPEMRSTGRYLSSPSACSSSIDGSGPFPRSTSEISSVLGNEFISEEEGADVMEQVDDILEDIDRSPPSTTNEIASNEGGSLCTINDNQTKCMQEPRSTCEGFTNDKVGGKQMGSCKQCIVEEPEDQCKMRAKTMREPRWRPNWEACERFFEVVFGVVMVCLLLSCQAIRHGMGFVTPSETPPPVQNHTSSIWHDDWVNLTLDGVTCYTEELRFTFGRGKCSQRSSREESDTVVKTVVETEVEIDEAVSEDMATNLDPDSMDGPKNQTLESVPLKVELDTPEGSFNHHLWGYVWSWRFVDYMKSIELWVGVVVTVLLGLGVLGGFLENA